MSIYRKKTDYALLFFLLFFLILVFAVDNTNTDKSNIVVYTFNTNKNLLLAGLCIFFIFFSILKKPYMDEVAFILLFSAVVGAIPYIYAKNTSHYLGNYAPALVSFVSYYICKQSKGISINTILNVFYFICITVSIQVVFTEIQYFGNLSINNLTNPYAKSFLNLPIGASNLITAYLLPIIVFIITLKPSCLSKIIATLACLAIILCRSKNAISLVVLILFFSIIKRFINWVMRDKSLDKRYVYFSLVLMIAVFSTLFVFAIKLIGITITNLKFVYVSRYSNPMLNYLDSISSGRVAIFGKELNRFLEHPLLGNGFGYDLGQAKSHNWIIELLVQKGIVGFVLYLWSIIRVFKRSLQFYKSDLFIRAGVNLLSIIYIQGLMEITVFTIGIDFLIWSIAGFLMARVREISYFGTVNKN